MKNYLRYLYAILAVPAIILIRFALLPLTGHGTPFITLFPATVIIALLGGMGPAILTGVVGVLLSDYFLIEPLHSWNIGVEFWSRTAIVVITSVFVGYVGAVLREARARAEKQSVELNRSRQDLERAQTVALTGSWRLDVRNNELTWSNEAYRIFGVPVETPVTYESFLEFINPDDREYVDQKWKEALKGEKYDVEHRIIVDGQIKWVHEKAELEYEKDGILTGGFGTVTDITERKKFEEVLQQQAQLLRLSYDAIIVWRKDGGIEYWNRGAEQLYGFTESEALGRITHMLLKTIHSVPWLEVEAEMRKHGQWEGELRHFAKDGHQVTVSARHQLVLGTDGIERILETNRDITPRKQMEEELRKSRDELARSNKDLEQFAYVASHDLQEPLRAVSGFVSLLHHRLEDALDEKTKEYMNFTVDGVSRMQTLINGLLAYSRIDTRGKPPQKTDSGKALEEALLGLQRSINESGAEITYNNLPTVNIDPVQLSQLFQNLISNAIKFRGDSPPQIHVSADRQNNTWRFAVKDNGIGIELQYAERIFLIFQRLHTRKKYTGTGIGLSLCKKIVERHGGKIWVESEPGHGSIFYFTIPDIEGALE